MQRTIQTLLLTRDPGLEAEVSALAKELAEEVHIVLHVEADERRAQARAMERRVDLLLVELEQDTGMLARFAEDLREADHPPVLVAVYRPQEFDGDSALSASFVDLMRAGVRDFLNRPLSTTDVRGLLRRELPAEAPGPSSVGRVVSFVGSKGGVGKSTVSANAAVLLARKGSTLLVDASLQHGVACDLLGLEPAAHLAEAAREFHRLDASLLANLSARHSSGVDVLAAPPNAIEAAAVDETVISRVIAVARRAYDFVVVDTFPLLDSVTLAILDMSDLTFVVLNDSLPTVAGTGELLGVLDRVGVDRSRARVILNRTHPGRGPSPEDIATRLDRNIDHLVPYSSRVLAAANSGKPLTAGIGRVGRWGRALAAIAKDASEGVAAGREARADRESEDGVLERVLEEVQEPQL
ncbi:MAG: AAA family ATPase [Planctomycetota bacterium]